MVVKTTDGTAARTYTVTAVVGREAHEAVAESERASAFASLGRNPRPREGRMTLGVALIIGLLVIGCTFAGFLAGRLTK